jgi:hypothetical protein
MLSPKYISLVGSDGSGGGGGGGGGGASGLNCWGISQFYEMELLDSPSFISIQIISAASIER